MTRAEHEEDNNGTKQIHVGGDIGDINRMIWDQGGACVPHPDSGYLVAFPSGTQVYDIPPDNNIDRWVYAMPPKIIRNAEKAKYLWFLATATVEGSKAVTLMRLANPWNDLAHVTVSDE